MAIYDNPLDLTFGGVFFELSGLSGAARLLLKMEGYNVTGSIKIKPALFMINDLERRRLVRPGRSTIVESSSGNLGIALALICNRRGYDFICVTDPNISNFNRRSIEAYGGKVVIIDKKDANGGYLESRFEYIRFLLQEDSSYVWLNQYANQQNWRAHAELTAQEILTDVPHVDYLYAGAGTTGTLMGLARAFAKRSPHTKIVAVEPEGSVTFDSSRRGRRLIPGIGTSRAPEIADRALVSRVTYVQEADAVRMCHFMARRRGLMLGGSSGSVLAAVAADARSFEPGSTVVAISPDLGDKYLDTVFSPTWVAEHYGDAASDASEAAHQPVAEPLAEVIARRRRASAPPPQPRRRVARAGLRAVSRPVRSS